MDFVHWRLGVCFLQMVMALGWGLRTQDAAACSPLPYPPEHRFYTLEQSIPADGATDVLPEGWIRVARRIWAVPGGTGPGASEFRHDVRVIDLETGAEVKGSLGNTEWNTDGFQYWKPESRLLPNRRYALVQSLSQSVPRPGSAQGPTQTRISFSTGNRQLSALTVLGRLQAHMDSYETTVCESGNATDSCRMCESSHQESRHGVWIQVPAIQGGFTFEAYRIEAVVTRDRPYDFSQPDRILQPVLTRANLFGTGESVEELLELPLSVNIAARPCVAWRVIDSLGNIQEGAPVCLDAVPSAMPLDLPGYLGLGCSLGGAGTTPAALGWLVLLARARRRTVRAS